MRGCIKCALKSLHPWHDNGKVNAEHLPLWEANGPYGRQHGQEGQR